MNPYIEIEHLEELRLPEGCSRTLCHMAFQYIDFTEAPDDILTCHYKDCCFLGCVIPDKMKAYLSSDCIVFPRMGKIYKAFTNELYNGDSLYADDFDTKVYKDYISKGKQCDDIKETLARAIHDHCITDAMYDFLAGYSHRDVVAVMGGHALKRTDEAYRKVALVSKTLTESGKIMVSGGGPGAMEATHLGAWMAGYSIEELDDAIAMLSVSPSFKDGGWLETAFQVRKKYPQTKFKSLGVPTWFYGHEPATPFATHIAKYFDNSIREDGILTIAKGGIIYSPGAAGTMQEVFQDAAQNHYETYGYASPMVFLGQEYYTKTMPVYPFLKELHDKGNYKNLLLSITDSVDEVVDILLEWSQKADEPMQDYI